MTMNVLQMAVAAGLTLAGSAFAQGGWGRGGHMGGPGGGNGPDWGQGGAPQARMEQSQGQGRPPFQGAPQHVQGPQGRQGPQAFRGPQRFQGPQPQPQPQGFQGPQRFQGPPWMRGQGGQGAAPWMRKGQGIGQGAPSFGPPPWARRAMAMRMAQRQGLGQRGGFQGPQAFPHRFGAPQGWRGGQAQRGPQMMQRGFGQRGSFGRHEGGQGFRGRAPRGGCPADSAALQRHGHLQQPEGRRGRDQAAGAQAGRERPARPERHAEAGPAKPEVKKAPKQEEPQARDGRRYQRKDWN